MEHEYSESEVLDCVNFVAPQQLGLHSAAHGATLCSMEGNSRKEAADGRLKNGDVDLVKTGASSCLSTDRKKATNSLSCESTFVEHCTLSERLDAVEANEERRTSVGTTASWGSSPNLATVDATTDFNRRRPDPANEPYVRAALSPSGGPSPFPRLALIGPPPLATATGWPAAGSETGVFMRELVDYLMEQRPLPDKSVNTLQIVPEAELSQNVDHGDPLEESLLGVDEAVETIERILKSALLHSSSARAEVVSLAVYHLGCLREERTNPLPEIPRVDRFSLWSLPRKSSPFL